MKKAICGVVLATVLVVHAGTASERTRRGVAEELLPIVRAAGIEAALERYEHLRATRSRELDFGEGQLNWLGYRLMQEKYVDEAIRILELNVRMFPRSANARDSLAEAHLRNGDHDQARKNYMRALSMLKSLPGSATRRQAFILRAHIRRQLERMELEPVYQRLTGIYQSDRNHTYSVSIVEINPAIALPRLRLVELHSGRVRTLHRKSDHSYVTGPGLDRATPVESQVRFVHQKDDVVALEIREKGERTIARRVDLETSDIVFNNSNVELEGTLLLPLTAPPWPAIVLVHGSGNVTRHTAGFGELSHLLALNGFVVLNYDKRGAGRSAAGVEVVASLHDLAGDAAAAIELLASHPDVDRDRIGLLGFSEGAWVAGLAAAEARETDFLILLAGGGVSPWEQDRYRVAAEIRAAGFADEQVEQARAIADLKVEVARFGTGWNDLRRLTTKYRRAEWYRYVSGWSSPEMAQIAWHRVWSHDPRAVARGLDIPVLAILAKDDVLTPVEETRAALESAFDGERSRLLDVEVVEGANRLFLECKACAVRFTDEVGRLERYAPGFFDAIVSWLRDR